MGLIFPAIDPVAIQIGPLAVRWYALAYGMGVVAGWQYVRRLVEAQRIELSVEMVDDLLTAKEDEARAYKSILLERLVLEHTMVSRSARCLSLFFT